MKFNKKITLLRLRAGVGRSEPVEESRAEVWADVSDIGVTTKYAAMAAGQTATLQVLMWRREFKDYTHAEYGGKRYKIAETGSAKNPLHIKLILERG